VALVLSGRRLAALAVAGLWAAVLATAPAAGAQPAGLPRVGFLGNGTPQSGRTTRDAFLEGLRERGWIDGQTVAIESRWAGGDPGRLPGLLTELVRARVAVIVLSGTQAASAARSVVGTVPVVFVLLSDPVAGGFVRSVARPGGTMTGMASEYETLVTKQLELLKEAVPTVSRVAVLRYAGTAAVLRRHAETAGDRLGLKPVMVKVDSAAGLDAAVSRARAEGADALHVLPSPFFNANRRRLVALAARHRLPAVYEFRDYVDDGGLMSYGPSIAEMFRGTASYVDRILKGARPGDLPVERPARFELAINLRTARALGLAIPPPVLARADALVE